MRQYSKDTYLSVSITPLSDRAQNYRPVSNLTFTSKIVERLVCLQLVDFLECTLLLPSLQSAYRKNHSTETAVLKVITDVLRAADRGEVTLLCLLDLSAAFDTKDHDILLAFTIHDSWRLFADH